jgi:hypothetical protein
MITRFRALTLPNPHPNCVQTASIFKALAPPEQADIFSFFGSLFSFLVGKKRKKEL